MSLAWTQKVKCEMKESSLYEQFTISLLHVKVESGLWYIPTVPPSMPISRRQRVDCGTSQQYPHRCLSVEGREWTVVHPNSTPIDAYQSKVDRESGCGTSQEYTHRCLSLTVASTQETTVCKCTSFVIYYKQHKNTNIIY